MQKREFLMKTSVAVAAAAFALAGCTTTTPSQSDKSDSSPAANASKRQTIDASVNGALDKMYASVKGSRELVNKARGVLVFPSVLQAGFVVGGEYGEGALRVGGKTQGYYNTVTASFGLQIGAQSKAVIFLFMTQDALDKFQRTDGWTAGADASVAVVKIGANGAVDLNTATSPVEVIVMTNAGLMANLNIEGTKVTKLKI
ncbi:BPSL1445 family SYLF domain-containing lipoprotein [Pandoraea commovens]|uniref:Lipoprotein n=1 Tax=Pandoraea commovens TaxID=2508289 RepID=A0A5E4TFC0_9BURK|nr:YSC84-related protein [Pandoraea commovens]UVA79420.1 YSC84-related protein [Pandoraea commovens]VVD86876.1 lipoprotein [Pandoraea commovens]